MVTPHYPRILYDKDLSSGRPVCVTCPFNNTLLMTQLSLARAAGFGPANIGTKILCLTAWRRPKVFDDENRQIENLYESNATLLSLS